MGRALPAGPLGEKCRRLLEGLRACGSAVPTFSGGVDSSLVAFLSHRELGARALAVTSASASLSRDDLALTRRLAAAWGLAHRLIETDELSNPRYAANPTDRCYFCKTTLYARLRALGYRYVTLDLQGFRSGSLNEGLAL